MRAHLEAQFPRACSNCRRSFATLREYLLNTDYVGDAPHDAEAGDWRPKAPMGTMTYANCRCGSTLALSSEGMPLPRLWSLMSWARGETKRRNLTPRQLLNYLHDEICKQVIAW